MNISVLNNSVRVSVDINADDAVNAIATNAAMLTYNVTKFVLDRAVEDSHKVYSEISKIGRVISTKVSKDCSTALNAGKYSGVVVEEAITSTYSTAKAKVIIAANDAVETRDAIITATKVKLESLVQKEVVNPIQTKTAEVIAPVKATIAQIEEAIADYTKIEEVEAIASKIESDLNDALVEEKPQVIGGSLISSAGVTPAISFDESSLVKGHKAAQSLTEMIKEEAAKQSS